MIQKIEEIRTVEVGRIGDICTSYKNRIVVYAQQGVVSGEIYGIVVTNLRSGGCYKSRTIMFSDLDRLEKIAESFSDKCEESRSL